MNKFLAFCKKQYEERPLLCIMIIAFIPRILSAIFAKGYGMHDDMFGPVQSMQEALDNIDTLYNDEPRLILYPFVQYLIFGVCEFFKIFDPQSKMYVVRIIHALYSLLSVYFSYKITLLISNEKTAKKVGIILALLWVLPYMSVRNLVEVVCIPPLMAAVYFIIQITNYERYKELYPYKNKLSNNTLALLAGLLFAVSFVIRYQTILIPFGICIVLLFRKEIKSFCLLALSTIIFSALLLGIPENIIWGQPFQHLINYLQPQDISSYPNSPWYMVPLLLIGLLIPPLGIMLFGGWLKTWKKYTILFIPVLLFILFHAIYPNKQERFMLTIIPLYTLLCIVGWDEITEQYKFWKKHNKLVKGSWIFFWIINILLLFIFTFTYGKKTRVESFTYLSQKDVRALVIEFNESGPYFAPKFYLGKNHYKPIYYLYKDYVPEDLINHISINFSVAPNYAIFFDDSSLEKRIKDFENNFRCKLKLETKIEPGLLDKVLHFTNPRHNKNYNAYIYTIKLTN
ncbi:MAG: glycosyltransferase family 39 protein [Bacteroidetes bacterium]|nr:glycosyltransferase family 39 protein [Bacteroidota bacterium]